MRFVRAHLAREMRRRSGPGRVFALQKQSHDSVLREEDRRRGAFERACFYLVDNPRRKGLVEHPRLWPYLGAVVPGYPNLHPLAEDFWDLLWKLYIAKRGPVPVAAVARPPDDPLAI
jgi:hypothetical protein